ncbi:hypothetical protein N7520_008795 [Penicillium odoratum]|uniref:uncharacterized protein n=1 Tax=Penicillium odoratum TaxID=1167516 RepID=UPI0025474504|nr:uncharacterized protein N7520_008795 [Penicillium odoratum]KAJ5751878.1 hypothetical protein N7520_008795 [Penicillium odoratum]
MSLIGLPNDVTGDEKIPLEEMEEDYKFSEDDMDEKIQAPKEGIFSKEEVDDDLPNVYKF